MTTFQKLIIGILGMVALCVMVNLTILVVWYVVTTPTSEQTIIMEPTPASERVRAVDATPTLEQAEVAKSTPTLEPTSTPTLVVLYTPTSTVASPRQASEATTKTPDSITDAVVAGGGKYVILKMQAFPGLAVYDADEKKIVHTLRLGSDNFLVHRRW